MEYAELNLYSKQGGEVFTKKNVVEKGVSLDENDKTILKAYRKKIIEQRQEIELLKERLEEEKQKKKYQLIH
jgi:hypothetical protein